MRCRRIIECPYKSDGQEAITPLGDIPFEGCRGRVPRVGARGRRRRGRETSQSVAIAKIKRKRIARIINPNRRREFYYHPAALVCFFGSHAARPTCERRR